MIGNPFSIPYRRRKLSVTGQKPPFYTDVIQWLSGKTYQADDNFWYIGDKKGVRSDIVQLGSYLDMNGIDNYINTCCPLDDSDFEFDIMFDTNTNSTQSLFDARDGAASGIVLFFTATQIINIKVNATVVAASIAFSKNEIHNLIFKKIGSNYIVTIDDIEYINTTIPGTVGTTSTLKIGTNFLISSTFLFDNLYHFKKDDDYQFYFDEKGNTTSIFDVSGNGNHGELKGTITTDTRDETITTESYNNIYGYNETTSGVFIPADQSNLNVDVLGDTLLNKGRVKYDTQLVNSSVLIPNGTDTKLTFSDLTGVTISDYEGDAIPTKNVNDIEYTNGTAFNLTLSDGTYLNFGEGDGTICYDRSGNSNHANITGTAPYWGVSDIQRPNNLIDGFSTSGNVKIPASLIDPTQDVLGNPLTNIGINNKYVYNGAETEYLLPNAPELFESYEYLDNNFGYNTTNSIEFSGSEWSTNTQDKNIIFSEIDEPITKQVVTYNAPSDPENLVDKLLFVKGALRLADKNNIDLNDEDDNELFVKNY